MYITVRFAARLRKLHRTLKADPCVSTTELLRLRRILQRLVDADQRKLVTFASRLAVRPMGLVHSCMDLLDEHLADRELFVDWDETRDLALQLH